MTGWKLTMIMPVLMSDPLPNLELARNVVRTEARCIGALAEIIGQEFASAARAVFGCAGTVILTGIGKAGLVAQKISGTLASTGTPSIFLHPVEALHGDLGRVRRDDVVIALSHSGSTDEIVALVDHLKGRGARLIAVTSRADCPLAEHADTALCYGDVEEACPLGLAPTASTSCMLALGDALALTVMDMRQLSPEDFAAFHPAGTLGRALLKVEEAMTFHQGDRLCVAEERKTVREVLTEGDGIVGVRTRKVTRVFDEQGRFDPQYDDSDLSDIACDTIIIAIGQIVDPPSGISLFFACWVKARL
ncbi:hypothetical protein LCGC14_1606690 [marine sediment metagenome]|uniref:SIS domain-containing protein n=1 Tax=marine sediment metagenome TaxID=412755 RepID=A0A0F9L9H5_9ZZZZ